MLHLTISHRLDRTSVTAHGELDAVAGVGLRRALARLVRDGATALDLDLGGVTFADASGLGVLARTWTGLGVDVALQDASEVFWRTARLSGRHEQFGLVTRDDAALA